VKKIVVTFIMLFAAVVAQATPAPTDFSGNWTFVPAQGKNLGMMAQGAIQTVITQSKVQVVVADNSIFNGQKDTQRTVYDLTGKAAQNMSPMAGKSTTHSHWEGKQLVTEWESAGAIAGSVTKRTEKRYLSPDGTTMFVESSRAGKDPIVMVFLKGK
jgi:hypothetical protein